MIPTDEFGRLTCMVETINIQGLTYQPESRGYGVNMKRNIIITILACVVAMTLAVEAQAQQQGAATPKSETNYREVPARLIPAPSTVSPELQAVIARPLSPALRLVPKTVEEWRRIVAMKSEQQTSLFSGSY